jgi:hypothetical protein
MAAIDYRSVGFWHIDRNFLPAKLVAGEGSRRNWNGIQYVSDSANEARKGGERADWIMREEVNSLVSWQCEMFFPSERVNKDLVTIFGQCLDQGSRGSFCSVVGRVGPARANP